MKKRTAILCALCMMGITLFTPMTALAQGVTVSSSAKVSAVPDIAEVTLRISATNEDASLAQQEVSGKLDTVLKELKEGQKVDEANITTTSISLDSQYDYDQDGKLTGYMASTSIELVNLPLEQTGALLTAAVDAGATGIDGVNFVCSNYDELYEQALSDAVKAAKHKADIMAEAADRKLGKVEDITEGYQDVSYRNNNSYAMAEMASAKSADMAVMPGTAQITAQVTVQYELED